MKVNSQTESDPNSLRGVGNVAWRAPSFFSPPGKKKQCEVFFRVKKQRMRAGRPRAPVRGRPGPLDTKTRFFARKKLLQRAVARMVPVIAVVG